MRRELRAHARHMGRWVWTSGPAFHAVRLASELITDGERLELRDEPGRALSETEACDAIRAGRVVEVVS